MAYIDIKAVYNPSSPYVLKADASLDGKYRVEYINDLWTTVPETYYFVKPRPYQEGYNIPEGQQVYITKGACWNIKAEPEGGFPDFSYYSYKDVNGRSLTDLANEAMSVGSDNFDFITPSHKGEIWVLVNKSYITNPIFNFDVLSGETQLDNKFGWKKLLQDGDATNANLQWEQLK